MTLLLTILLFLLGLALTAGGVWLLVLGGSPFYALCGITLLVCSRLLNKHRTLFAMIFAVLLLCTQGWALWESGWSWWPLATRTGLLLLLAIPLLLVAKGSGRKLLLATFLVCGCTTLASLLTSDRTAINGKLELTAQQAQVDSTRTQEWLAYGGDNMGQRYAPVSQITKDNIGDLQLAWQYQTGDTKRPDDVEETTYEATPLKLGNGLFLCTPHNWLVALDADSGEPLWVFKAEVGPDSQRQHQTCRGVSYYASPEGSAVHVVKQSLPSESLDSIECKNQLFLPTSDARLIALDPNTGAHCKDFAVNGELDLMHNMPFKQPGYYYSTSPPLVAAGKVIVAGSVNDNYAINSPSGVIRAYDAHTGQLMWNWDSGRPTETQPIADDQTYTTSSPNSWSVASADEQLGLAYFPMGNRTPDQLGMYRTAAEEKYASSVVALDLETGQPVWVQQFVHHDLWDMDTPAQPVLMDLTTDNGKEPALVVPTKQGDVYVLNRKTGAAIVPIHEHSAPQGAISGDFSAPTQPASELSFNPPPLTEQDMWGGTLLDQMLCRIQFKSLNYNGRYTPPSERGTLVYPGNFGVFNWGSVAVDLHNQVMFGMPLYLAFVSTLEKKNGQSLGATNTGEQGLNENAGADYAVSLKPFLSPLGIPCQQPPWGYVAGVDLRTGDIAWKHKNGTIQDLTPLNLPIRLGVPGIGGPIITQSGVVFMAAAVDNYLRAYDLASGDELWHARLPAGGQATPMTYLNSKGEQMVVLVAGGHGSIGTTPGDYVLAYKLNSPDNDE